MPASMTSEDSGSRPKVIGSSMAMVGIGPMPGNTPISVPRRQPRNANPRFLSDAAALKPVARLCRRSSPMLPAPPGRKRLRQPVDEQEHAEQREASRQQQRLPQSRVAAGIAGKHGEQRRRDGEPQALDQVAEGEDRSDDHQN